MGSLVLTGCGGSSGSATQGCEHALDGGTAAAVAHGSRSVLAASRAEARAWKALSPAEQRRAVAACVARGGAPGVRG